MEPAHILVIDDERVICDGCRLVLAPLGFTVESCLNGRSGMEAIRRGAFDLVLLDMKLPDIDGMDILKTVHQEKPDLAVIVMTGYFTVENVVAAMKLGADDYLTKPFTDDAIVFATQRALEKRRLVVENRCLRQELADRYRFDKIVGENARILDIFNQIQKVAPEESTVLLYGESGTGKELFAGAIHSPQPAGRQIFRGRGLQHPDAQPVGERAVRTCERGFYRRRRRQGGHFRNGRGWHALSGRCRQFEHGNPGQTAPGAGGV
jgi:DNA-binding NtrC family response regulator